MVSPAFASQPDVELSGLGGKTHAGRQHVMQPNKNVSSVRKNGDRIAVPSLVGAILAFLGLLQQVSESTLVHPLLLIPGILACVSFTMAAVLHRRVDASEGR